MKFHVSIKLHMTQDQSVLGSHKITFAYRGPRIVDVQDKSGVGCALLEMCQRGLTMFSARSEALVMNQSSHTKLQQGIAADLTRDMQCVLRDKIQQHATVTRRLQSEQSITGWQLQHGDVSLTWGSLTCIHDDIPFDMHSPALALLQHRPDGVAVHMDVSTTSADRRAMPVRTYVVSTSNEPRLLWHQAKALQQLPHNVSYKCRRAMVKHMHLQSLFYLFADAGCFNAETTSHYDKKTNHIIVHSKNPLGLNGNVYSFSAQV